MSSDRITFTETELRTIFTSSCIEAAARAENCTPSEMYKRMKEVDLVEGYIWKHYDSLHTQSRQYVTDDVLEALHNRENKKTL